MNLHEMRNFISKAYPGQAWKNRVKKMGESQVIAIYYNLINRENPFIQTTRKSHILMPRHHGRSNAMRQAEMLRNFKVDTEQEQFEQLSMFDIKIEEEE